PTRSRATDSGAESSMATVRRARFAKSNRTPLNSMQCALHGRHRELAADHRARVEVVEPGPRAQRIDVDMTGLVARESVSAAFVEQRAEAPFVVGGFLSGDRRSVHGGLLGQRVDMPLRCTALRSGSNDRDHVLPAGAAAALRPLPEAEVAGQARAFPRHLDASGFACDTHAPLLE